MKFFIRINPATIRKNPNANKSVYYHPGRVTKEKVITKEYSETYYDDKLAIVSAPRVIREEIKITQDIQELHSMPQPKWLYEYMNSLVECKDCGAQFSHLELLSNECDDYFSYTICPCCGVWDCCELEFESMSEDNFCLCSCYGCNVQVCKGYCGCKKCGLEYQDFLSGE